MKKLFFASMILSALIFLIPINSVSADSGNSDGGRNKHKGYGERMMERYPEKVEKERAKALKKKKIIKENQDKENKKHIKAMIDLKKKMENGEINLNQKQKKLIKEYKNKYR